MTGFTAHCEGKERGEDGAAPQRGHLEQLEDDKGDKNSSLLDFSI